ncbi:MAG: hypothetical protein CNCCGFBP_01221 [Fimbriimonadaceae bacterium]|nr:hypothetical protein [Fimbriimonadaceae bacterium]
MDGNGKHGCSPNGDADEHDLLLSRVQGRTDPVRRADRVVVVEVLAIQRKPDNPLARGKPRRPRLRAHWTVIPGLLCESDRGTRPSSRTEVVRPAPMIAVPAFPGPTALTLRRSEPIGPRALVGLCPRDAGAPFVAPRIAISVPCADILSRHVSSGIGRIYA